MEVRAGFNTEFGRRKFDVTYQESDFALLLGQIGIPLERAGELTTAEKFQLMWLEAEIFAKAVLIRHLEAEDAEKAAEQAKAESEGLRKQRTTVQAAVKTRLGIGASG